MHSCTLPLSYKSPDRYLRVAKNYAYTQGVMHPHTPLPLWAPSKSSSLRQAVAWICNLEAGGIVVSRQCKAGGGCGRGQLLQENSWGQLG